MPNDFEIGRVVAVDTAQVTIELNEDLKSFSRSTFEGVEEIGRINSYIVMPVGARRLVAMVTRVSLTEEAELRADRTMVTLPSARRIMKATLIGSIEAGRFKQGISTFPILDNPVLLAARDDIGAMFDVAGGGSEDAPGYCLAIGESAVLEGHAIRADPDAMFGKHLAVLGSTGSGKSCTVAAIIQAILSDDRVKRAHFVILDTNGEYRDAFQKQTSGGWQDAGAWRCLYVPSDQRDAEHIVVPYWFLNSEDFARLFRAREGAQRPVLLEALRLARNTAEGVDSAVILREEILQEMNRIVALASSDEKTSKDVRDLAAGLSARISDSSFDGAWTTLETYGVGKDAVDACCDAIKKVAEQNIDSGTYPKVLPADSRASITSAAQGIIDALTQPGDKAAAVPLGVSADSPSFFDRYRFRAVDLEQVLRRQESGARARDYCGTMLLRIDRLFADPRFEFLLGPRSCGLPHVKNALASFLRDILGLASTPGPPADSYTSTTDCPEGSLPFYDRQRSTADSSSVVILDLSLLASEVLENVTALLGRLILEFLQRLGEEDPALRGSLPVVLVLDEAQNYIGERVADDGEPIARTVFERIAREGRKFGLSLVVASQRPSELSKTVLAQCSSFIVHRLQNPEDLRYFREVVPAIYGDLLGQLPALAPQTALVLGECVRAPALVRMREAEPLPRSRDPRFWSYWTADSVKEPPVEAVCGKWEGDVASCDAACTESADMGDSDHEG